jgi:hypothetical protein
MFLLFLFNFICQLRSKGAEEKIHIRNAWQKLTRAFDAVLSMGGTDMRTNPPRVGIPLALGIVLLLILAFPSSLYASDLSLAQQTRVHGHSQQVLAVSVTHHFWVCNREHPERRVLLMDAGVRLRATAGISSNPRLKKLLSAQEFRFESSSSRQVHHWRSSFQICSISIVGGAQ